MSVTSSIELRFIHKQPTTPEEDEVVRITPYLNGDNVMNFMWRYLESSRSGTTTVSLLDTEADLQEKLRSLVALLTWDSDPYEYVQLLLPTMPAVLFKSEDFSTASASVFKSITTTLRHWPAKMSTGHAKKMSDQGVRNTVPIAMVAAVAVQEAAKAEQEAAHAATNTFQTPPCCTRSGRCYSPLAPKGKKTASRVYNDENDSDESDCSGPPPLVRMSNKYDLGDGYSYFANNISGIHPNPEEEEMRNSWNY